MNDAALTGLNVAHWIIIYKKSTFSFETESGFFFCYLPAFTSSCYNCFMCFSISDLKKENDRS